MNKKIITITLSLSLIFSSMLIKVKAEEKVEKEETLYVIYDSEQDVKKKQLNVDLKSEKGFDSYQDHVNADNIELINQDIDIHENNSILTWTSSEKNIQYKGDYQGDLPLELKVQYDLDGKKAKASELVGKSGRLTITVTFNNLDIVNGVINPYLVLSVIPLNNDHFKNVTVENGYIKSDGQKTFALGLNVPGVDLEEIDKKFNKELVIKADVNDFQMDSSYFFAIPSIEDFELSNIDTVFDMIDDSISEVVNASDEFVKGSEALKSGSNQLKSGTSNLAKGSMDLSYGSQQLLDALMQVNEGTNEISIGQEQLIRAQEQFGHGLKELEEGSKELVNHSTNLSLASSEILAGIKSLDQGLMKMNDSLASTDINNIRNQKQELLNSTQDLLKLTQVLDSVSDEINIPDISDEELAHLPELDRNMIQQQIELKTILKKSSEGIKTYANTVLSLEPLINKKINEMEAMKLGVAQLNDGSNKLSQSYAEFDIGLNTYFSGIERLNNGIFQIRGAHDMILENSKKLQLGQKTLSGGIAQIYNNDMHLHKGIVKISEGANELNQGTEEMDEGINQLNSGLKLFNETLVHTMEEDVDLNFFNDLKSVRNSLSDENEATKTNYKIIMKTEAIEAKKEKEEIIEVEEKQSFWDWLFRRNK